MGDLTVQVVDAANRAVIVGASVSTEPLGISAVTDGAGVARLSGLPAGVYTIVASAPTLSLSGATVVAGSPVQARAERTSVLAGRTASLAIELDRIDRTSGNLAALHAGGTGFLDASCVACHGDRRGEVSGDPARKPFHAMATHASKGCTFCHAKVDILGGSGAALRKQVSASRCKGCHPGYPASF